METPTQKLINTLKSYPQYENLSEYYIRKDIGLKHNIKRAKNEHLQNEINQLSSKNNVEKKSKKSKSKKSKSKKYKQTSKNVELPSDAWEEILLQSDNLKNICMLNKTTIKICESKNFWIKKFEFQQLPYDWVNKKPQLIQDWIKQYDKLLYAKSYAKKLIELFQHLHQIYPDEFFSIYDYAQEINNYYHVLSQYTKKLKKLEKIKNEQQEADEAWQYVFNIRLFENNTHYLTFYLEDDQGDEVEQIHEEKSLEEIEELLMRWLFFVYKEDNDLINETEYQLPDLVDGDFSYFYDELKENMDFSFNKKDYHQKQYKMLKTRLDFLKLIH